MYKHDYKEEFCVLMDDSYYQYSRNYLFILYLTIISFISN